MRLNKNYDYFSILFYSMMTSSYSYGGVMDTLCSFLVQLAQSVRDRSLSIYFVQSTLLRKNILSMKRT